MTDESNTERIPLSEVDDRLLKLLEKTQKLPLTQQHLLEDLIDGLGEGKTKVQQTEAKNVVMSILGLIPKDLVLIQQIKQLPNDQQEDLHRFIMEQLDPVPELEALSPHPIETQSDTSTSAKTTMSEAETEELAQNAFEFCNEIELENKRTSNTVPLPSEQIEDTVFSADAREKIPENDDNSIDSSIEETTLENKSMATEEAYSAASTSNELSKEVLSDESQELEGINTKEVDSTELPLEVLNDDSENTEEVAVFADDQNDVIQSENLIQISTFGKRLMVSTQTPIDGLEEIITQSLGLKFRNVFGLLKSLDKNAIETVDQEKIDELVKQGIIIKQICYPVAFSD